MSPLSLDIIISGVMARPFIFDKSDPRYLDVQKKKDAFQEIAEYTNTANNYTAEEGNELTGDDIQTLWDKLVDGYKKACRESNNSKSGDGQKICEFPYMEELSFLQPFIEQRPVVSFKNMQFTPQSSYTANYLPAEQAEKRNFYNYTCVSEVPRSSFNKPSSYASYSVDNAIASQSSPFSVYMDPTSKRKLKSAKLDEFAVNKKLATDSQFSKVNDEFISTLKRIKEAPNNSLTKCNSINYTEILAQAFAAVPDGKETECLNYVLDDFEEFEKSIKE